MHIASKKIGEARNCFLRPGGSHETETNSFCSICNYRGIARLRIWTGYWNGRGPAGEGTEISEISTEVVRPPLPPPSGDALDPADIEYLGAFRLPGGDEPPLTFAYGGNAMTFNPDNNSLFISGHDRANGLLYVLELYADGAKPLVHVWRIH